jgi:hypothetical protein
MATAAVGIVRGIPGIGAVMRWGQRARERQMPWVTRELDTECAALFIDDPHGLGARSRSTTSLVRRLGVEPPPVDRESVGVNSRLQELAVRSPGRRPPSGNGPSRGRLCTRR